MITLQRTLLALFGAALTIILLITAGAAFNASEGRYNYELSRDGYQRLLLMEDLITTLLETESSQRAFLITGDNLFLREHQELREQLARYQSALEDTVFPFNNLEDGSSGDGQSNTEANLLQLRGLIATRLDHMDSAVATYQSEGAEAAANAVRSYGGKLVMDNIRRLSAAV